MLSSTEAEIIDAVNSAKTAIILRFILHEIGFPQEYTTPINEDDDPNIDIVTSIITTERTHHIDVLLFSIQGWKEDGDIIMHHIPGIINPAYNLTKALGWVLHSRHARYPMGRYNISFGSLRSSY